MPVVQLQADGRELESHGLSLYSDAQAVAEYRRVAATDTEEGLFRYTPPAPTQVEFPSTGSVLSGNTPLFASAVQGLHPIGVHFVLSGRNVPPHVLVAKKSPLGWASIWNVSTVPDGEYQIVSVVQGQSGLTAKSHPVSVIVRHQK